MWISITKKFILKLNKKFKGIINEKLAIKSIIKKLNKKNKQTKIIIIKFIWKKVKFRKKKQINFKIISLIFKKWYL
jgi:hypothetical protein